MTLILTILSVLILLALLLVLSQTGRHCHPGLPELGKFSYAHRGLHGEGIPENSLAAFRRAKDLGYGVELDIHLLKDGNLAIMHDSHLKRTTGKEGVLEDLTTEDLKDYPLEGTDQVIPTFREVLDLFHGAAPIVVELKSWNNNCAALSETAARMLDEYPGAFCVESFDPRCVLWMKKHRPDYIRGQLAEDFLHSFSEIPWILRFIVTHNLANFITKPDFVAYKFEDRKKTPTTVIWKKLWKLQPVAWTIRTPEDFEEAKKEGWIPIFEGFQP